MLRGLNNSVSLRLQINYTIKKMHPMIFLFSCPPYRNHFYLSLLRTAKDENYSLLYSDNDMVCKTFVL